MSQVIEKSTLAHRFGKDDTGSTTLLLVIAETNRLSGNQTYLLQLR
jgi:hypothetical protein